MDVASHGGLALSLQSLCADELGAAMYPPQDEDEMRDARAAIAKAADGIRVQALQPEGDHEVVRACETLIH